MRILITGAAGFIGSHLADGLIEDGHEIWKLSRRTARDQVESSRVVGANLLNAEMLRHALDSVPDLDIVIHCAAIAHGERTPSGYDRRSVNVEMTRNLIQAVKSDTIKVILLSSIAVYPEGLALASTTVESEPRPLSEYGLGKHDSEILLFSSNEIRNSHVLRLAPVYDDGHLSDIKKRVFLPGLLGIRWRFSPNPKYSLCHVSSVLREVKSILSNTKQGRWLHLVADAKAHEQSELGNWFTGLRLPLPTWIFRPVYLVAGFLPEGHSQRIRSLYGKLFLDNLYQPGLKQVD